MHVSFMAHLDDSSASSVAKWRNLLLLDPFQKFGGGFRVYVLGFRSVGIGQVGLVGCAGGGGGQAQTLCSGPSYNYTLKQGLGFRVLG